MLFYLFFFVVVVNKISSARAFVRYSVIPHPWPVFRFQNNAIILEILLSVLVRGAMKGGTRGTAGQHYLELDDFSKQMAFTNYYYVST